MGLFKPKDKEATTNMSVSHLNRDADSINPINISSPAVTEEPTPSGPKSTVEEMGACQDTQDTCAVLSTADRLLRDIWGGGTGLD